MDTTKDEKPFNQVDILENVMEHLDDLQNHKFTGQIKINYTQGAIARIEKYEEISQQLKRRKR